MLIRPAGRASQLDGFFGRFDGTVPVARTVAGHTEDAPEAGVTGPSFQAILRGPNGTVGVAEFGEGAGCEVVGHEGKDLGAGRITPAATVGLVEQGPGPVDVCGDRCLPLIGREPSVTSGD